MREGLTRISDLGFPACSYEQFDRIALLEIIEVG
jgi:hypothetical protein